MEEGQKKVSARYVKCMLCSKTFSRGLSNKYSMPTTNMLMHLKNDHPGHLLREQKKKGTESTDEERLGTSGERESERMPKKSETWILSK